MGQIFGPIKKEEVKQTNKNTKIKTQYINTKLKHSIITYETI